MLSCLNLPLLFSRRANAQQPRLFVAMILILIFAEALALYGLIGKSAFSHFQVENTE